MAFTRRVSWGVKNVVLNIKHVVGMRLKNGTSLKLKFTWLEVTVSFTDLAPCVVKQTLLFEAKLPR